MSSSSRDRMLTELVEGQTLKDGGNGDASNKTLLVRGCDPVMAERAGKKLPPLLGNPKFISCTDDNAFLQLLQNKKYDVVVFAPGACRWDAAKKPIPGGNKMTEGYSLANYEDLVRKYQGNDIPIVQTTQESEMVPLMREALGLS